MKIVTVLGSPRPHGNTARLAQRFLQTAENLWADVTAVHRLAGLHYEGCRACYACKGTAERCVLRDDLTPILQQIEEADLLLLATPVYFSDVTGQMKLFIDRFYSFLVPDFHQKKVPTRLKPKKLALIVAQGAPDPAQFQDVPPRYEKMLRFLGFIETRVIRACGLRPGGEESIPAATYAQIEAAANELIGTGDAS